MCEACNEEYTGTIQEHSRSSVARLKDRFMTALEVYVTNATRIGVRSEEPVRERDLR